MNSPRAEAAARLSPGRIRAAAAGVQGKAGEDQTPVEARGTWRAGTAMEKGTCLSSSPFEAEEALGGALVADRCSSTGGGRGRDLDKGIVDVAAGGRDPCDSSSSGEASGGHGVEAK